MKVSFLWQACTVLPCAAPAMSLPGGRALIRCRDVFGCPSLQSNELNKSQFCINDPSCGIQLQQQKFGKDGSIPKNFILTSLQLKSPSPLAVFLGCPVMQISYHLLSFTSQKLQCPPFLTPFTPLASVSHQVSSVMDGICKIYPSLPRVLHLLRVCCRTHGHAVLHALECLPSLNSPFVVNSYSSFRSQFKEKIGCIIYLEHGPQTKSVLPRNHM